MQPPLDHLRLTDFSLYILIQNQIIMSLFQQVWVLQPNNKVLRKEIRVLEMSYKNASI